MSCVAVSGILGSQISDLREKFFRQLKAQSLVINGTPCLG